MKERRKGHRRKAQRRVDVESAKRYLGMDRRLSDRRADERRGEEAAAG